MAIVSPEPAMAPRSRSGWVELMKVREVVASLAITTMWVAVAVCSVWGPDFVASSGGPSGSTTTIPSGIFVALFAFLASWVVAKYAFRHEQ